MHRPASSSSRGRGFVNLTPMIDVVFQLIIFFMLVAQFSSQQAIELVLPRVTGSLAELVDAENRLVVNVVPLARTASEGGAYRVGTRVFQETPEGIRRMSATIGEALGRDPNLRVLVRADRAEACERVHPALQALSLAGARDVELMISADPAPRNAPGGGP